MKPLRGSQNSKYSKKSVNLVGKDTVMRVPTYEVVEVIGNLSNESNRYAN